MCGGGTQTTTTKTEIPPEVLARYNAVNARAEEAAKTPFQPYTGEFVAGLTPTQQAGIQATSDYSQTAQPYFGAGAGLTMAGSRSVGPLTQGQIGYYMNPYTNYVAGATQAALQQQQGQQLSQQQADAIRAGAFGGDRAGIQRAVLQGQQGLATAQALAPIYSQGYGQAVQTAQGQQGIIGQDLQRQLAAGQQIANIGQGAQGAALQGAQAQIGAGTLQQQTAQAGDTAQYQQFLQQRGYPFQVAQFLANIAEGTGALSGSTQTTQAPAPFFSDKRLKHDAEKVGEMHDGTPIYRFKYNGSNQTQIGLMAQDVEKRHPEAVGQSHGYKTVDYKAATDEAAHKADGGGIVPNWMGGAVREPGHFALGGLAATDLSAILAQQQKSFGPFSQSGLYGGSAGGNPYSGAGGQGAQGYVPAANLHVAKMPTPNAPSASTQPSTASQLYSGLSSLDSIAKDVTGKGLFQRAGEKAGIYDNRPAAPTGGQNQGAAAQPPAQQPDQKPQDLASVPVERAHGGLVPRGHFWGGGPTIPGSGETQTDPGSESGAQGDVLGKVVKEGAQEAPKSLPQQNQPSHSQQQGPNPLGLAASGISAAKGLSSIGSGIGSLASGLGAGAEAAGAAAGAAGAAGGIGSALGSIGTGVMQVLPFLGMIASDERVKHNKREVGKLYDGQPVYSFDFGDGRTQIGLMAQNVERKHPEAVAETHGGLKMVDYHRATENAAHKGHYYEGGLVPPEMREHHAGPDDTNNQSNVAGDGTVIDTPEKAAAAPHPADRIFERRVIPQESGGKQFDKYGRTLTSPAGAVGIAQVMPSTGPEAAKLAGVDWDEKRFREDPAYNKQLGQSYFRAQYDRYNNPEMAMAAYNAGPGNVDKAIARARATGGDWRSFLPNETQNYIGMGGPTKSGGVMGALRGAGDTVTGAAQDAGGFLSRNKDVILPILQGLGAMAGSKSRYLGSAILEGLGAGAKAYGDIQSQQAGTEQTQAQTQGIQQLNLQKDLYNSPNGPRVLLADGTSIPPSEYEALRRAGKAPLTFSQGRQRQMLEGEGAKTVSGADLGQPGAQGTQGKKFVDTLLQSSMPNYGDLAAKNASDVYNMSNESLAAQRETRDPFTPAAQRAAAARAQAPTGLVLGDALSGYKLAGGPLTGGLIQPVISRLNNLLSIAGIAPPEISKLSAADDVIKKYRTVVADAARTNAGGKGIGELQQFMSAIPSNLQDRGAQADLVANMIMEPQKQIDTDDALRRYRRYVEQQHNVGADRSIYSGEGVAAALTPQIESNAQGDKAMIKNLFLNGPKDNGRDVPFIPSADGKTKQTGTFFTYLYNNGGNIPDPKVRSALDKAYGKERVDRVLRVFQQRALQ